MTRAPDPGDVTRLAEALEWSHSVPLMVARQYAITLLAPGGAVDTIANQRAEKALREAAGKVSADHERREIHDLAAALRNGQQP